MFNRMYIIFIILQVIMLSAITAESDAASRKKLWPKMCASCHDGKTAPDKDALRNKYPTFEKFSAAVLGKGDRCMNILKKDRNLINRIAAEIGVREPAATNK